MRRRTVLAMVFSGLLAACGSDADETAAAAAAFERFQLALQRGDESACRELLTTESRTVLSQVPWETVRDKQPLTVLGVDRDGAEFSVRVRDPNEGGQQANFVVVREYGRLVVDLVASAGLTARTVEASGSRQDFEPRELTPADHDRIRKHELAQPPR